MITVLLIVLAYVASMTVFLAWAKAHAPEGHEDDVNGFVFAPVTGVAEKPVAPATPRPLLTEGLGLAR